jgi:predicted transcriptional regulator
MAQAILEMAKDLVMAQIQRGALAPEDMHKELQKTHASLMDLKTKEEGEVASVGQDGETAHEPMSWKKSIGKYTITCLECGASFKQLSVRHLKDHEMDARSYRAKYGIPRTQPLSAKDTTALRKKIVQQSKPWEKAPTYRKAHEAKAGNSRKPKASKKQAAPKKRPAAAKA